jgi:thiamine biosynthesis protein ThiS
VKIRINDEERDFAPDATILDVVTQLGLNPKVVVAQRNGDIVPREAFGSTALFDGDTLDLVRFVGGG